MADSILLNGTGKLVITTDEGKKVEREASIISDMFQQELVPPMNGVALPDGTKFVEYRDPLLIVVHQQPPHVRQLRWIADDSPRAYGSGVKYRKVRLSFPYTVTFATFMRQAGGQILNCARNELYFSNVPIKSKEDKLSFPALLNISVMNYRGRDSTWICTQYLKQSAEMHWTQILEALLEHTWNGAFNLSSEHHEGASWFTKYKGTKGIHPVEDWQKETEKDDAYALKVNWKPAGTVGSIIEAIFGDNMPGQGKDKNPVVNRIIKFAKV